MKKLLDNINLWKNAPIWDKKKIKIATADWFKYASRKAAQKNKSKKKIILDTGSINNRRGEELENFKEQTKTTSSLILKNKIPNGIKFDLSSDNVSSLIKKFNINKIILLSAIGSPDECFKNKKKSHSINVKYTL